MPQQHVQRAVGWRRRRRPNPLHPPSPKQQRAWYAKFWALVEEPKSITIVQIVFTYGAALVFGALTLTDPPRTTSVILGPGLVTFICWLMITAGFCGTITAFFGWWWVERLLGLGLLAIAWGGYVYSVGEAHFLSEGSRWLQAGFLSSSLSGMITRYIRIRRDKYGPGVVSA